MFRIDASACIAGAVLLLVLPLKWLLAAFLAAAIHELFHLGALYLVGGRVVSMRIGLQGTVMETTPMSTGKELFCAAAGPVGSLLLIFLCRVFPLLGICAGVQALFNLLPVYPLDGGRVVRCGLFLLLPQNAAVKAAEGIEWATIGCLALLTAAFTMRWQLGLLPLAVVLNLAIRTVLRKRPCKERRIRVQ